MTLDAPELEAAQEIARTMLDHPNGWDSEAVTLVASAFLSLQDQLTQVRAENETYELNERSELTMLRAEKERAEQHAQREWKRANNLTKRVVVAEAAEKREKALRDAAQAAITWLKAKEHDGTHARPCTECQLVDLFRRILERGEQW